MTSFHESQIPMDFIRGCVIDFDLSTGLSNIAKTDKRYLSQMKGMFANEAAFQKALEKEDPLVYQFHNLSLPHDAGDLSFGCSILNPGKVGNEYYFTKGHFHTILEIGEVYYCLKGHGYMLLENMKGDWSAHKLAAGKAVYVPKGYAHRSINVSADKQLITFFVYRADAGHNYGTIESKGFRNLLLEVDSLPQVVDNPKWK